MKKRAKLLMKYFRIKYLVTNVYTSKLLLMMALFKLKCFLVKLLREIYQLCMTWLYITHKRNICNLDEVLDWEKIR